MNMNIVELWPIRIPDASRLWVNLWINANLIEMKTILNAFYWSALYFIAIKNLKNNHEFIQNSKILTALHMHISVHFVYSLHNVIVVNL